MTDPVDRYGKHLLFSLCAEQREDEVLNLLRNPDLDINVPYGDGSTLLMWAIDYGLKDVVSELLTRPNLNYKSADINGGTALTSLLDSISLMSPEIVLQVLNKEDVLDNLTSEEKKCIIRILTNRLFFQ